jgi:hypothetical protein
MLCLALFMAPSTISRAGRRQTAQNPPSNNAAVATPRRGRRPVQYALVKILNAVYENDFMGFSYGFRPGRSQHDALDALATGLVRTNVNWVLDADISLRG